jgi:histidine triad (HIT) family protein
MFDKPPLARAIVRFLQAKVASLIVRMHNKMGASQSAADCIFCKIAQGQIASTKLLDDDFCFAIADVRPQSPKHFLVIPKQHIQNISQCQDAQMLGRLFQAATALAKQEGLDKGFRLVVNTGDDGGQTVHHLHIHVLGGRFMTWPPG